MLRALKRGIFKAYLYKIVNYLNKNQCESLLMQRQPHLNGLFYKIERITFFSAWLERNVIVDFISPKENKLNLATLKLLILNDGQDLPALGYMQTLDQTVTRPDAVSFVTLAIHAGDRVQEYGVSGIPDFKDRGSRAGRYHHFLAEELIGRLLPSLGLDHHRDRTCIAGFSLSGLSALDFCWQHSELAGSCAAFSGSFWWRSKALDAGYTQADRIMHRRIRETVNVPALRVWLQAGTHDEKSDRTGTGVIDTIADITDLIAELHDRGVPAEAVCYHEMERGLHNQETWGKAMPRFLQWYL